MMDIRRFSVRMAVWILLETRCFGFSTGGLADATEDRKLFCGATEIRLLALDARRA